MRRWLLIGFVLVTALVAIDLIVAQVLGTRSLLSIPSRLEASRPPILVGLIHSQSGPLAFSERSLVDAEVLALEEINARGGILGRLVSWEIADGRSDPSTFASQGHRLIEQGKVDLLVGAWTSECRKALLAVVEKHENLLIFPANFEGIEKSPRIIYAGGSANQVIMPAVRWCFDALKAKRFYVVGTEEVWSRCVAELAKDAVKASGGEMAGESYLPLVGGDTAALVESIQAAKPDVVLNVLVGDSNIPFYGSLQRAGVTPAKLPVLAFSIAEDELRRFQPGEMTGYYSAYNYFQSIDRPENLAFVRKFKARYGEERVTSDAMVAAYNGLMIWAKAVEESGTSDPSIVLERFDRQSLAAPEGIVTIDPESRIAWRPFHVGRARADGQFDLVWSISKPIQPELYVLTRPKARWQALLVDLNTRWEGRWSSSELSHPNPTPSPK